MANFEEELKKLRSKSGPQTILANEMFDAGKASMQSEIEALRDELRKSRDQVMTIREDTVRQAAERTNINVAGCNCRHGSPTYCHVAISNEILKMLEDTNQEIPNGGL